MLRVYLDQAKWIDLSKCRVGHPQGKRFQDVYDVASEAVSCGRASFVLSCAHYYETQRRTKAESRVDLGTTMALFSLFHSIAPPQLIVPAEIRQCLTGEDLTAQVNLFGVGMKHAFNTTMDLTIAPAATLAAFPPEWHAEAAATYAQAMEFVILAAPPMPNNVHERMLETASMLRDGAQMFVDGQNTIADHIVTHKLRSRLPDVSASSEIADFLPALIQGCQRHSVDLDELLSDRETIYELLRSIPSRWVSSELRRVRLRNPQQPWTKNDLNDILALSIAVPYCDIVVTERQWARHINDLGFAQQYGTVVLHDLTDLTEALVSASVAES